MARLSAPLYTQDGAAEYLGVSRSTVRRMIARGELRAYRVGRGIRFREADLEAALTPLNPATFNARNPA